MKRSLLLLVFTAILSFCACAQNFSLTINSKGIRTDSLHFQVFDKKKDFKSLISVPYSEKAVLKNKEKMAPGYYQVSADSSVLFSVLISEEKKTAFVVNIGADGEVQFANSDENNHYIAYTKEMALFGEKSAEITKTFEEAQKTLPQYMLQTLAEKLMKEADTLIAQEKRYKNRVIEENAGTLMASIIRFSMEPEVPREYYGNRAKLIQFFTEHAFDNFAFEDGRMSNTPMLVNKLKEISGNLYYLDTRISQEIVDTLLMHARVNAVNYHTIFDHLEKVLGTLTSPYWTEDIYITMLRNALSYDQIEQRRVNYYKQVLELHTKNLAGTILPNFDILLSDGTETTLYDIECEYMLLYFQNPDCPTCTEVRGKLAVNEDLNRAIESGKLKMVTIYFEKDEELWRRYLQEKANPKYLHGWDYKGEIEAGSLFDLRIIPYMFLLDKNKRVIKKDIYHNEISDYLKHYRIY